MAELSPVAKAVWEAWLNASDGHYDGGEWVPHHADSLAAALRALANQAPNGRPKDRWISAREIFAIAAELEGGKATTPEPAAGPTDEELLRTYGRAKRDYCYEGPIDDWPKRAERAATVCGLRAVLARCGHQPTTEPVAGLTDEDLDQETAMLISWLLDEAIQAANSGAPYAAGKLTLAAQLLGKRHQPTTEPAAGLPPRPPLQSPAGRSDLVRYGVTWDGSPDKPLLTPMPDGYWTPWHLAAQPPQPIPLSDPPGSCPASGL